MEWARRGNFAIDLFGKSEEELATDPELLRQAWSGKNVLRNLQTGERFQCGSFRPTSLRELRALKPNKPGGRGRLNILVAKRNPQALDVGFLQSQPENRGALFQVASNFNALELQHKFDRQAMTKIGNYIFDRTQGPFASISAAPGLVLRHYYAFHQKDSPPQSWAQKFDGQQVELLGETSLKVRNGYLELRPEDLEKQPLAEQVRVGVHRDIQVTFGQSQMEKHHRLREPSQEIDQVFTASADLAGTNREFFQQNPRAVEGLVKALLLAAYEGTLLAAIAGKNKKVFLTLIGGGVFANPQSWIVDILENLAPLIASSGLEVCLNTYRGLADPVQSQRLAKLAEDTGGELRSF